MKARGIAELLAEHEFFKGLDPSLLDELEGCGHNSTFAVGDVVFREGGSADHLYIVRSGRVALNIHTPTRELTVDTVETAEILGVSWLVPPYRWQFDAQAIQDTHAVVLDATCLRAKCDAEPALGYEVMKRVAGVMQRRMQSARIRLMDMYGRAGVV